MTTLVLGLAPMMPNTGAGLVAAGASSALRFCVPGRARRVVAVGCGVFVLALGIATLAQYLLGVDFGIDQLLVRIDAGPHPGRASPVTTVAFTLLGLALVFFERLPRPRLRPAEWLAVGSFVVALIGIVAYEVGTSTVYQLPHAPVVAIALPSTAGVLVVSASVLLLRPTLGVMSLTTATGPGGVLVRRFGLLALVSPPVVGLLIRALAAELGVPDVPFTVGVVTVAMIPAGLALVVVTGMSVERAHVALATSREELFALFEHSSEGIFVADERGHCVQVNEVGARLFDRAPAEIIGKAMADLLPLTERERLTLAWQELVESGVYRGEWSHTRARDGTLRHLEVVGKKLPDGRCVSIVRDVSTERSMAARLRREHEKFAGIIALAEDAIVSIDENECIRIFNEGAARVFGWRVDEVLGQPFECLVPERLRSAHHEHMKRFTTTGHWSADDVKRPLIGCLRRGGEEFCAEASLSRLDVDGGPLFTVMLRDMTARLVLERELADARAFLENVLESSTEYSVIAEDLERRVVLWNEGARRNYGFTAEEVVGRSSDVLDPPDAAAVGVARELHERALANGHAEASVRRQRKDGTLFTAKATITRRLGADGAPIGYLTISQDITRVERLVDEQLILSRLGTALTTTLDYDETLRGVAVTLVPAFAEGCMIDLTVADAEGAALVGARRRMVVLADPTKKGLAERLERAGPERDGLRPHSVIRSGSFVRSHVTSEDLALLAGDEEHRHLLEELRPVSLMILPLVARGAQLGAMTVVSTNPSRRYGSDDAAFGEEIAQRAAVAIDNARLYQTSQRAIRARDDVLAIVAHDLRGPLSTAALAAEQLLQRHPDEDRRLGARKMAEMITRATRRAHRLIEDLLEVAKLESGAAMLDARPEDPDHLVREAVEAVGAEVAAHELELRVELPAALPRVSADEARVLQVLTNLIGNSIKFTPPHGRIRIGARTENGAVCFWVSDTGAGMPKNELAHVFDRFWQAHRADRRGAGLGLPIAKGIVEAHGGRIWGESSPGEGSSFYFTLPLASALDSSREVSAPSQH